MRGLRAWLWRLSDLVAGGRRDRDLADELESHLQLHIDDNLRSGMTPEEARRHAIIALGGIEPTKERYRDRRGIPLLAHARQDFAYAIRVLGRSPGFTAAAVATLALGIGANAAIFTVVNAVLLRPLPFPDSSRLVAIWATEAKRGALRDVASYPDFTDWKTQSASFDSLSAYASRTIVLSRATAPELAAAARVGPDFFETLRVRPALGRAFVAGDQTPDARVVMLNDGFWRRELGAREDILGRTLGIDGEPYTIVGVMPRGFQVDLVDAEAVYLPLPPDPNRGFGFLHVIGRLRPTATVTMAQSELTVIAGRVATVHADTNATIGARVEPLVEASVGDARLGLLVLLGVVALVLVIACTNVANLMLARGVARRREMAVRAALGASRLRLVRQLLTESLVLSAAGAVIGLLLSSWTTTLLAALLASHVSIPRLEEARVDVWVLGFTMLLSMASAVVFGVAPALASASPQLADGLHESSRSASGGVRTRRLRRALVVAETALALVLLVGAGALLRTLLVMRATPPGFDPAHVLVVHAWLAPPKFTNAAQRTVYYESLLERARTMRGISSAALVADLPLGGNDDVLGFHIVGRPDPADGVFKAGFNIASSRYFTTMGIPVDAGREFGDADRVGSPGVVVINRTAALRFWPGQSPLGQRIVLPGHGHDAPDTVLTVVGITGDVHHLGLDIPPRPELFVSSRQSTIDWPFMVLVARTSADPAELVADLRTAAASVDSAVPIPSVTTMGQVVSETMAEPGLYALLLGVFAGVALALAAVGLYGLLAYTVSQRSHEMGIRLALGAAPKKIVGLVLGEGLALAGAGALVGLALAFVVMRSLAGVLPGLASGATLPVVLVTLLLMLVAAVASVLPARRASRVDPLTALRSE